MTEEQLRLSCTCGKLRGKVAKPRLARRIACYCDDCQAYARALGRARQLLDAQGGTEILQTTPKRVEFIRGREQLRCLQLRPGGLYRWYSACCNTPVANTLKSAHFAFVGIPHLSWDLATQDRDATLGPVQHRLHCRYAHGEVAGGHESAPTSLLFRVAGGLLLSGLRGEQRPSPFFAAGTGEPQYTPQVLSDDARI